MAKYRKKPVEVEAVQLTRDNFNEVLDFITLPWGDDGVHGEIHMEGILVDNNENDYERVGLVIPTLEGNMTAVENDYIIKGVQGEFYPCKPGIFHATYEQVGD